MSPSLWIKLLDCWRRCCANVPMASALIMTLKIWRGL